MISVYVSGRKACIAIEPQIQRCLNGIQKWADENGFQFSQSNTLSMHFSQFPSANVDPDLKLYGASIPVVNKFKFLGLIFDKKLYLQTTHQILGG